MKAGPVLPTLTVHKPSRAQLFTSRAASVFVAVVEQFKPSHVFQRLLLSSFFADLPGAGPGSSWIVRNMGGMSYHLSLHCLCQNHPAELCTENSYFTLLIKKECQRKGPPEVCHCANL